MGLEDVASRRETMLPWTYLRDLVGEEELKAAVQRVESVAASVAKDERDRLALDVAKKYVDGWRPDREIYVAPSKDFGARKYAEYVLINLLESGVPAKRKTAYERVREMTHQARQLAPAVLGRLSTIATSSDMAPTERLTVIELLEGSAALGNIESELLRQVFSEASMPENMAWKIASLFQNRIVILLDRLESVDSPTRPEMASRLNAVLQVVAACLTERPAELDDRIMQRAVEISQQFKDLQACKATVERIQKAFDGETR